MSNGKSLAGVLAVVLVATAALSAAPRRPAESYGEAVVVREADITTDPAPLIGDPDDPRRWLVLEDGLEREVVRVELLNAWDAEPWDLVVWLDSDLAPGPVRLHAGAALSRLASELAARGPVALWSEGREVAVRAEARGVETLIADAAAAPGGVETASEAIATIATALDRLLVFVDTHQRSGPGVLIIPAAPLLVDPSRDESTAFLARLDGVADILSGYGWTVVVLPFLAPSEDIETGVDDRDEYERWREDVATEGSVDVFGIQLPPRRRPTTVERITTQIEPALAVWRRFVAPGGGWVVDSDDQVRRALTSLSERRRLWYRTAAPLDGSLRRVEARWRATGQSTRAQAWRRAGTPQAVAEARLRAVLTRRTATDDTLAALDRRAGRQGLPAAWWRVAGGVTEFGQLRFESRADPTGPIRVQLTGSLPEAPAADRRARLSCVVARSEREIEISHSLYPWEPTMAVDCATPGVVAVAVEDLATGVWGARFIR